MFIPTLDEVCAQTTDRFSSEQTQLMKEMSLFSTANMVSDLHHTTFPLLQPRTTWTAMR